MLELFKYDRSTNFMLFNKTEIGYGKNLPTKRAINDNICCMCHQIMQNTYCAFALPAGLDIMRDDCLQVIQTVPGVYKMSTFVLL